MLLLWKICSTGVQLLKQFLSCELLGLVMQRKRESYYPEMPAPLPWTREAGILESECFVELMAAGVIRCVNSSVDNQVKFYFCFSRRKKETETC